MQQHGAGIVRKPARQPGRGCEGDQQVDRRVARDAVNGRPVWPRVARVIMPRIMVAIAPAVGACSATLFGTAGASTETARSARPTGSQR